MPEEQVPVDGLRVFGGVMMACACCCHDKKRDACGQASRMVLKVGWRKVYLPLSGVAARE